MNRFIIGLALAATATGGCSDPVVVDGADTPRGNHFSDTDRLFVDFDDDPACKNFDGSNSTVKNLVAGDFVANDLTRSIRQEAGTRRGFPDAEAGPLFGGDACSPNSKAWAGGYYAAGGVPPTMGEWCDRYGLSADCQNGNFAAHDFTQGPPRDLNINYFNAHALPVFRVTLCNSLDSVDRTGRKVVDPTTGVGFACVNLNYICPERVSGTESYDDGRPVPGGLFVEDTSLPLGERRCDPTDPDDLAAGCQACEAVSVTMHYDVPPNGTEPAVIFGGYRGTGRQAELMDRIDLDFDGKEEVFETIPNICNSCHGGAAYAPTSVDAPLPLDVALDSQFLPINPRYALRELEPLQNVLKALKEAGGDARAQSVTDVFDASLMRSRPVAEAFDVAANVTIEEGSTRIDIDSLTSTVVSAPNGEALGDRVPLRADLSADLEDTFEINRLIRLTKTLPVNDETLATLDVFDPLGAAERLQLLHADTEIPAGWSADESQRGFYRIIAEHCNDSCHLALKDELGFADFATFTEYRDTTYNELCRDYSMPQSPESFNLFWSKSSRVGRGSRGNDVEQLLAYEADGWPALSNDGECPIPPLALNVVLKAVEFTSPKLFEEKRAACVVEVDAERGLSSPVFDVDDNLTAPNSGLLQNCAALCSRRIFCGEFEESAKANLQVCDELEAELGVVLSEREEVNCDAF
ncbi:MAG: hypothetical protein RMA76_39360 [Deltaproteobacteria bacterium]